MHKVILKVRLGCVCIEVVVVESAPFQLLVILKTTLPLTKTIVASLFSIRSLQKVRFRNPQTFFRKLIAKSAIKTV